MICLRLVRTLVASAGLAVALVSDDAVENERPPPLQSVNFGKFLKFPKKTCGLDVEFQRNDELSEYQHDLFLNVGDSDILVVQVLTPGDDTGAGPQEVTEWVPKMLNVTVAFTRKFGYTHLVRTAFSSKASVMLQDPVWEKYRLVLDYLKSSKKAWSHILYLDLDATMVHLTRDSVALLAEDMHSSGASLAFADEDWHDKRGPDGINVGLFMARNTPWMKALLEELTNVQIFCHLGDATKDKEGLRLLKQWRHVCCGGDHQCFQDFAKGYRTAGWEKSKGFNTTRAEQIMVVSGMRFNRHPNRPCFLNNYQAECSMREVEFVHFMGREMYNILRMVGMLPFKDEWGRSSDEWRANTAYSKTFEIRATKNTKTRKKHRAAARTP